MANFSDNPAHWSRVHKAGMEGESLNSAFHIALAGHQLLLFQRGQPDSSRHCGRNLGISGHLSSVGSAVHACLCNSLELNRENSQS